MQPSHVVARLPKGGNILDREHARRCRNLRPPGTANLGLVANADRRVLVGSCPERGRAVKPEATTLSKAEFAAHIGVTPGRVSQYIADQKISGDALIGKGRAARIHVETARQQLLARLDPGQMLGNGKFTQLGATPPTVTISAATAAWIETAVAREFDRARDRTLRLLRAELGADDGAGDADASGGAS